MGTPDLVLPPKPGDPDRAEDLLDEIQAVLQKRNACLKWERDSMVLAIADPVAGNWRAIAKVQLIAAQVGITRGVIRWMPLRWEEPTKQ